MEYRQLGRSGLSVSVLSLGTWVTWGQQVGDEVARECILTAREAGVNFIDTAEVYADGKAEEVLGRVFAREGFRRADWVIATKIFWGGPGPNDKGLSRKHIMEGIDAALERLQMEYVDLVYCHRPDPKTPIEETVWAMSDLVRNGLAFYWGTSEWPGAELRRVCEMAEGRNLCRPQVEQPQFSLLARKKLEEDVRPAVAAHGMGLVVWSPLASGLLSGKYDEGVPKGARLDSPNLGWLRDQLLTEDHVERVRRMKSVADQLGCSRAQLALAWAAAQPGISSVILGATRVEQLVENLGALDVKVDASVSAALDAIFPGS